MNYVIGDIEQRRMHQVDELMARLPLNSMGLPTGFWRVDLLPLGGEVSEAELEAAWVPLDYRHGYPALPDGDIFWNQLDFEGQDDYEEFRKYVGMGSYRVLPKLVNGVNLDTLRYLSTVNYWHYRARAYDICEQVARRCRRDQLIYELEDEHLAKAAKYMAIADKLICSDRFQAEATPRDAIALAKLAFQVSRVSVRLPGLNPPPEEGGSTINVEQLTVLHREDKTQIFVDKVLASSDLTAIAQDLAVKLMMEESAKRNQPQSPLKPEHPSRSEVIDVE